jgi:hypothetical protein
VLEEDQEFISAKKFGTLLISCNHHVPHDNLHISLWNENTEIPWPNNQSFSASIEPDPQGNWTAKFSNLEFPKGLTSKNDGVPNDDKSKLKKFTFRFWFCNNQELCKECGALESRRFFIFTRTGRGLQVKKSKGTLVKKTCLSDFFCRTIVDVA